MTLLFVLVSLSLWFGVSQCTTFQYFYTVNSGTAPDDLSLFTQSTAERFDDAPADHQALPFPFRFYAWHRAVTISPNGVILFNYAVPCCSGGTCYFQSTTGAVPCNFNTSYDNIIAPSCVDYNPSLSAAYRILYGSNLPADSSPTPLPTDWFAVRYDNVPLSVYQKITHTFTVVLYRDGGIQFKYFKISDPMLAPTTSAAALSQLQWLIGLRQPLANDFDTAYMNQWKTSRAGTYVPRRFIQNNATVTFCYVSTDWCLWPLAGPMGGGNQVFLTASELPCLTGSYNQSFVCRISNSPNFNNATNTSTSVPANSTSTYYVDVPATFSIPANALMCTMPPFTILNNSTVNVFLVNVPTSKLVYFNTLLTYTYVENLSVTNTVTVPPLNIVYPVFFPSSNVLKPPSPWLSDFCNACSMSLSTITNLSNVRDTTISLTSSPSLCVRDCQQVWGGSAVVDDCNICVNRNSSTYNSMLTADGICLLNASWVTPAVVASERCSTTDYAIVNPSTLVLTQTRIARIRNNSITCPNTSLISLDDTMNALTIYRYVLLGVLAFTLLALPVQLLLKNELHRLLPGSSRRRHTRIPRLSLQQQELQHQQLQLQLQQQQQQQQQDQQHLPVSLTQASTPQAAAPQALELEEVFVQSRQQAITTAESHTESESNAGTPPTAQPFFSADADHGLTLMRLNDFHYHYDTGYAAVATDERASNSRSLVPPAASSSSASSSSSALSSRHSGRHSSSRRRHSSRRSASRRLSGATLATSTSSSSSSSSSATSAPSVGNGGAREELVGGVSIRVNVEMSPSAAPMSLTSHALLLDSEMPSSAAAGNTLAPASLSNSRSKSHSKSRSSSSSSASSSSSTSAEVRTASWQLVTPTSRPAAPSVPISSSPSRNFPFFARD